MRTSVRLWRTVDDKLVLDGDAAAVVLAYGENDEVETVDAAAAEKLQPKVKAKDELAPEKTEGDGEPKAGDVEHARKRTPRKRAAAKA